MPLPSVSALPEIIPFVTPKLSSESRTEVFMGSPVVASLRTAVIVAVLSPFASRVVVSADTSSLTPLTRIGLAAE